MGKAKTKIVVNYLLDMINSELVTDEEIKDVVNTIWYILEANDMVEEYLPQYEYIVTKICRLEKLECPL